LQQARLRDIPLLLVSGIFREQQPFFKWYGNIYRQMLHFFTHLFVQNETSLALLQQINIRNASISGDTRFDRVVVIAGKFEQIDIIEKFCKGRQVVVAGSTWSEDDEELNHYANSNPEKRFIIVPHDIRKDRLQECKNLYRNAELFSSYIKNSAALHPNTLIIDNIGMLSRLYKYATVCYVGGAFGDEGVHNVLEAAVYYKPVVFGPVFEKYIEAVELIDAGGAFSIENALELEKRLNSLFSNSEEYQTVSKAAGNYVKSKTGATEKVIQLIQEKRLLTK
jgi:3-deoxy-D-manno-octulosonic-acid transferase